MIQFLKQFKSLINDEYTMKGSPDFAKQVVQPFISIPYDQLT